MNSVPVETAEIRCEVKGSVGLATLNRPKAINSITHSMVTTLRGVLKEWAADSAVTAVVLSGAGERGLCAGGDVVAIYHSARGDGSEARRFWYDEYQLNALIGSYPKPYVSLMDGIVMGGGVGVGAHGNTRVVTDKSKIGMPEVGIGFIPDVGGTYLISRAPGLAGLHAGLTGAPFNGADAIALGFADHYVLQHELADFTSAIVDEGVSAALETYSVQPPPSELIQQRWINECYTGESVAEIVAVLGDHDERPANDAANLIASRSPTAVSVTLEAVRRAGALATLEDVLVQEYRTSCAALSSHDLVEGIRAQLIDKDRKPKWSPASLADVESADVEGYFASRGYELDFEEPFNEL
jgi:enoyl-CoA hydratase